MTEAIEALDPEHRCSEYWDGKADREAAAAGLAPVDRAPRPPRALGGGAPRPKRSRRARCALTHPLIIIIIIILTDYITLRIMGTLSFEVH